MVPQAWRGRCQLAGMLDDRTVRLWHHRRTLIIDQAVPLPIHDRARQQARRVEPHKDVERDFPREGLLAVISAWHPSACPCRPTPRISRLRYAVSSLCTSDSWCRGRERMRRTMASASERSERVVSDTQRGRPAQTDPCAPSRAARGARPDRACRACPLRAKRAGEKRRTAACYIHVDIGVSTVADAAGVGDCTSDRVA